MSDITVGSRVKLTPAFLRSVGGDRDMGRDRGTVTAVSPHTGHGPKDWPYRVTVAWDSDPDEPRGCLVRNLKLAATPDRA